MGKWLSHLTCWGCSAQTQGSGHHTVKFRERSGKTEGMRHSFLNKTIGEWNHLPAELAKANSLPTFRRRMSTLADTMARWSPSSLPVPPRPRTSLSHLHLLPATWWRHQNGNIWRVTGPLWEESTGHQAPSQRPVTRSFTVSSICAWTNGWANDRNAGD